MSNKNQNPFADFFANCSNNPFAEAFNWDEAVNAGRQNAKAFTDAAKAAGEGAQAIARRQAEIAQKAAEDFSKFFKDASAAKNPEDGIAKQAEFAKASIESALKNASEISEIAAKSNKEAADIISKRISNAFSEVAANATPKKKANAA